MRAMAARALVLVVLLSLTQDAPRPPVGASAAALFDAYASGTNVDAAIAKAVAANGFVMDLKAGAAPWIEAVPAQMPRRRLVVAAVALEIAAADLRARAVQQMLIPWGVSLLGKDPPSEGERAWYRAAVALTQRLADPFLNKLPAQALARFPDDERFQLARVLLREQDSWRAVQAEQRTDRKGGAAILDALAAELEALTPRAPIEGEARLRLGHTYLRLDRHADAWAQLARVEPLTRDRSLLYLTRYFSGRARLAMGDAPGAAAAFRSALELFPRAQSASFALASLVYRGTDRAEAYALVDGALAGADGATDPWRSYQEGDYRLWPDLVAALRKQVRSE